MINAIDIDRLTEAECAALDASLAACAGPWWDSFYENRAKACPFFGDSPDESLAQWLDEGVFVRGQALDLGCGNGRNAMFLARQGFSVEAIDHSRTAIDWAKERIAAAGLTIALKCQSVFEKELEAGAFDLVYDSGCFHHIPPHRRRQYVEFVVGALKPGGWFGLTCFTPEGGSGYSDHEVYERLSLGGGLGYTEHRLREIWSEGLDVRTIRVMVKSSPESGLFGESFLWALLAQKP